MPSNLVFTINRACAFCGLFQAAFDATTSEVNVIVNCARCGLQYASVMPKLGPAIQWVDTPSCPACDCETCAALRILEKIFKFDDADARSAEIPTGYVLPEYLKGFQTLKPGTFARPAMAMAGVHEDEFEPRKEIGM